MPAKFVIAVFAVMSALPIEAALTVTLTPTPAGSQPLGTTIRWNAVVTDSSSGNHTYRFLADLTGQPLQIRQDFGPNATWSWTPTAREGNFTIRVVVKNTTTNTVAFSEVVYQITSRLVGGAAAVNPTNHPLVALFSAPACMEPNTMRVQFHKSGDPKTQFTDAKPCRADPTASQPDLTSMNFLVAGMYPTSTYLMKWETLSSGGAVLNAGTDRAHTTGPIPASIPIPQYTQLVPPPPGDDEQPLILQSIVPIPRTGTGVRYHNVATDMQGLPLWYSPVVGVSVDRTRFGGNLMATLSTGELREIDLAGNTVLETNVTRLNEQLVARGMRPITSVHHDVRRIHNPGQPNHDYIVALTSPEMISTSAQGGTPTNPVDIIGDGLVVLDHNLQLVWAWDAFQHLNINRAAVLGETCVQSGPGCPPFNPAFTIANDWLHANSVQHTPWDGNFVISLRHQDWVIKVNYANGAGDGSVLWRMGPQGDFTITSNGTGGTHDIGFPWFSHQHDSEFELRGTQFGSRRVMTVFDNGNTRQSSFNNDAHSRCQSLAVDETNRTVNLNINADVGQYAFALGSAQLLTNGNLHCNAGVIGTLAGGYTLAVETDKAGTLVYVLRSGAVTYRSFRMSTLYTPVTP